MGLESKCAICRHLLLSVIGLLVFTFGVLMLSSLVVVVSVEMLGCLFHLWKNSMLSSSLSAISSSWYSVSLLSALSEWLGLSGLSFGCLEVGLLLGVIAMSRTSFGDERKNFLYLKPHLQTNGEVRIELNCCVGMSNDLRIAQCPFAIRTSSPLWRWRGSTMHASAPCHDTFWMFPCSFSLLCFLYLFVKLINEKGIQFLCIPEKNFDIRCWQTSTAHVPTCWDLWCLCWCFLTWGSVWKNWLRCALLFSCLWDPL